MRLGRRTRASQRSAALRVEAPRAEGPRAGDEERRRVADHDPRLRAAELPLRRASPTPSRPRRATGRRRRRPAAQAARGAASASGTCPSPRCGCSACSPARVRTTPSRPAVLAVDVARERRVDQRVVERRRERAPLCRRAAADLDAAEHVVPPRARPAATASPFQRELPSAARFAAAFASPTYEMPDRLPGACDPPAGGSRRARHPC